MPDRTPAISVIVCDSDGNVYESIDASDYDLSKSMARSFLASEVLEAVERAARTIKFNTTGED